MLKKFLFITLLCVCLTGCAHKNTKTTQENVVVLTEAQEKSASLKTSIAQIKPIEILISIPAEFKTISTLASKIYAPADGKVEKVFVEQGQFVKKGQVLATIQSDFIGQIQSEFLQNIIQIDSDIKISTSQMNVVKNAYNRENILLKEKVTSVADFESARSAYEKERANLNALYSKRSATISVYKQRLALYGGDESTVGRVLSSRKIYPYIMPRANKSGILLTRFINPEEFIFANKEMFEVADLSKIWLVGNVFDADISKIKIGEQIFAEIEGIKKISGTIVYVAPQVDLKTRALEVRAEIDNPDGIIKPNMFAQMIINTGDFHTLVVPRNAIQKFGDVNLVFVKTKEYTYVEKQVEVGEKTDVGAEILSGIKEGDEVVTDGSFYVLGQNIKQIEEE